MATRSIQNQQFHDQVIGIAAGYFDQNKFTVYVNPGAEKRTKVGESYPDIIVTAKGNVTAIFVIEVETQDSVNAIEASTQWKEYARLGSTFYLLVPKESLAATKSLCAMYSVKAKFASYWVEASQLKVHYE